MSSTASRQRAIHSRSPGRQGARAKPQLPMITLVTPCQHEQLPSGSHATCASIWVWPSMKPGARISPSPSTTRFAGARIRPISAMRPPATPTSARNRGAPEPSTTSAPRTSRSRVMLRLPEHALASAHARIFGRQRRTARRGAATFRGAPSAVLIMAMHAPSLGASLPSRMRGRLAGICVFARMPARRRRSQGRPWPVRRTAPGH